jgi:hypothetical protein
MCTTRLNESNHKNEYSVVSDAAGCSKRLRILGNLTEDGGTILVSAPIA